MRMARDTATGRLYCQTATCTSASIATGLDTVKVSTCSKTVPGITAIGGTDANMVKGSSGTLTERDTKPYGRGCFTFENLCMQHGHYIHMRDPAYDDQTWMYTDKIAEEGDEEDKSTTTEGRLSPRTGILPMWRARCVTPYNPELLPPEAAPLREASTESLIDDKSEDDVWPKIERDYPEEEHEEYYQGEASSPIDSP
ncbi:uncharacterized protein LOC114945398 [Nylanderia fulva]|uniref:uncharacterized protein LOC114945398 n=1 Tax=Nylanderia fulva TaxID=613905 RepID=UPI0010FBB4FC|nr:uncharacterized protein LOC114945398 [Nylanderia fulva]